MRSAMILPVIIVGFIFYCAYVATTGENGFGERTELEAERDRLKQELAARQNEVVTLTARVARLDAANPDLDYIEERAKASGALVRADEWVVTLQQP